MCIGEWPAGAKTSGSGTCALKIAGGRRDCNSDFGIAISLRAFPGKIAVHMYAATAAKPNKATSNSGLRIGERSALAVPVLLLRDAPSLACRAT